LDLLSQTSFVDGGSATFANGADVTPWDDGPIAADFAVSQWDDQSGLNNHATAPTLGHAALFQPGVVNGRPVLRFDSAAGYVTPLGLNTPCTVFAVYALNGAGDLPRCAVSGSNNWLIGPYGAAHDFFMGEDFTGGPALMRGVFVAQAGWQTGSASRNFVNGSVVGNPLGGSSGPGLLSLAAGGAYGEALDGDLAEVIAYDSALSTENMANVWSYLAAKYSLS